MQFCFYGQTSASAGKRKPSDKSFMIKSRKLRTQTAQIIIELFVKLSACCRLDSKHNDKLIAPCQVSIVSLYAVFDSSSSRGIKLLLIWHFFNFVYEF